MESKVGIFGLFNKKQPSEFDLLLESASIHEYNKDYHLAVRDFSKLLNLYPDFMDAYRRRAWAYFGLKQYKEALSDFNKYISSIEPGPFEFKARAEILCSLERYNEAVIDLVRVSTYKVENNPVWILGGKKQIFLDNKDKLLKELTFWSNISDISVDEANEVIKRMIKLFF